MQGGRASGAGCLLPLATPHAGAAALRPDHSLHCGAVVASDVRRGVRRGGGGFQSPSLRGSGRFVFVRAMELVFLVCFNPLHCGAVVASESPSGHGPGAGHAFQSPSLRGSGRFTDYVTSRSPDGTHVSIPFIAGQWSLRIDFLPEGVECDLFQSPSLRGSGRFPQPGRPAGNGADGFQSPSLRGSGRFKQRKQPYSQLAPCFNPLHCGAVVASRGSAWGSRQERFGFQSPSLRGSGRFVWRAPSSPPAAPCFNPLHCGAVVASRRGMEAAVDKDIGFNPLHCGAVVASSPHGGWAKEEPSFNPLHCGAVVASGRGRPVQSGRPGCFNPLHCGAVVASSGYPRPSLRRPTVSIPFIAGQWSLHERRRVTPDLFQVSIPFIAGQWSLHKG